MSYLDHSIGDLLLDAGITTVTVIILAVLFAVLGAVVILVRRRL